MAHGQFQLLGTRRFLPLFVTQFCGALNDNFFKNALVILVTYGLAAAIGANGQILVTLASGLFILPFFLFSATAGRLADKLEKQRLILAIKAAEIAIMGIASWGFATGSVALLMTVLFLMGVHSTFFGPLKYGILPAHLAQRELLGGNALIEAGTFLAILIGTIAGGLLIRTAAGVAIVSVAIITIAAAGFLAALFIPRAAPPAPGLRLHWNILADTAELVREARQHRDLWLAILGISWFWLVGATFLSQFPNFAKDVIGGDEHVVTLFLTAFTIGIALGSLLCNRLLKGEVSARFVPLGALGISLFTIDLVNASARVSPAGGALIGFWAFLGTFTGARITADLILVALCGGLFIVPLYTLLQARSDERHRSRIIAANNILNALFMVAAAVATMALLAAHVAVPGVFLIVAIANLAVALWICKLLPGTVPKAALAALLRLVYRVEVKGAENYRKAGPRAVLVANHVSFLDGPLLGAFLPGRPIFPVNTAIARLWWARPLLAFGDTVTLDPTNPLAAKALIKAVQGGRKCVIFPEGRITVTGALMKIYEGPGMIADKADAPIVPIRIDGAQYTPFSRLKGKLRRRRFPRITITILEPRRIAVDAALRGRARRRVIGRRLYDVMVELIFATADYRQTLFAALLDARHVHGGNRAIVEDTAREPISYDRLVAGSFALGRRILPLAARGERVGVLLPNSIGLAVAFFALQATGRVPALLNFSGGAGGMLAACRAARLAVVLTSRRFIAAAKLDGAVAALAEKLRIIYLEDIREDLGLADRLYGAIASRFARRAHRRLAGAAPGDPAVVLFTSGSEGTPKGVVLSHANILANRHQLGAVVDFNPTDAVFNALPLFHAFGLTGGLLLPVLTGVKTFLYPTPLHYRIVPELVYDSNATIVFGTDTFLTGYARVANAYDFHSVRYVFAGAEKVRDETRRSWSEKFGLRILEGYGLTETAPVIATNTPMHFRAGTVGRPLPGLRLRIDPVPGIDVGGRLSVAGPNVMLGYLRVEAPGVLEAPPGGWFDTGDIVECDDEGYLAIKGRAKRFAKIAGEMVSLAAVEELAARCWPEAHHAALALPDARRGEQAVLVTDHAEATREALLGAAREAGLSELFVPKIVLSLPRLPLLATGKTDYPALAERVRARLADASAPAAE
ncbi:MAG TPA: acyl-[ACP]--phospholipid O-acyltransferase [Stellaceae bacterium]|nr:acyl-[ACP]--phospholipid O-acyltransferase [Stellaceae bacterium]